MWTDKAATGRTIQEVCLTLEYVHVNLYLANVYIIYSGILEVAETRVELLTKCRWIPS
jgi:hypothetical protein